MKTKAKRKTKYVYKLLSIAMYSAFMKDIPSLKLRYELGKERRPRIGKLFAFDTARHARMYVASASMPLFKCKATGAKKLRRNMLDASSSLECYKLWWGGLPASEADAGSMQKPPRGTVICDSITPIEQL